MIVYSVEDDFADNGTGLVFYATQKEAFDAARKSSKSEDEEDGKRRPVEVAKVWLVQANRRGCIAMLNNLFYAEKSEVIATFQNGRKVNP